MSHCYTIAHETDYKTSNMSKAHETRESLEVPVRRLSWSPSMSSQFAVEICMRRSRKLQKNNKITYFGSLRSFTRSSMLTSLKSSSLLLVMISSMSVSICNRFHATPANSGKITCAGLLEPKGSGLGQLKSTLNDEYYIRRLSWFISSHFVAIHC